MARPDGRLEKGQAINRAISAARWNDLCDAADIVHGRWGGMRKGPANARTHVLSRTSELWSKGTSQTLSVYAGTQGSETQTSDTISAWNSFAEIAADRWVMLTRVGNGWYVIAAECG